MKKTHRKHTLCIGRETVRLLMQFEMSHIAGGKFTQDDTCDICDPSIARICSK